VNREAGVRIVTYNLRCGWAGEYLPPLLHQQRHLHAHWMRVESVKWGSGVYVKGGRGSPLELPDFHGHLVGVEVDAAAFPITAGRPLRVLARRTT
jgi:hypothetical protein